VSALTITQTHERFWLELLDRADYIPGILPKLSPNFDTLGKTGVVLYLSPPISRMPIKTLLCLGIDDHEAQVVRKEGPRVVRWEGEVSTSPQFVRRQIQALEKYGLWDIQDYSNLIEDPYTFDGDYTFLIMSYNEAQYHGGILVSPQHSKKNRRIRKLGRRMIKLLNMPKQKFLK